MEGNAETDFYPLTILNILDYMRVWYGNDVVYIAGDE
jgi:hypothetical protein